MKTLTLTPKEAAKVERDRYRHSRAKEAKAARPKSEKADRGRVRDNGYLAFLRRQPCVCATDACVGQVVQAAHVRFGDFQRSKPLTGMQVKPDDRWALPLCRYHHAMQHAGNERAFYASRCIDALATAERLYAEYRRPVPDLRTTEEAG